MFEKVNPCHPDKVADRIAGAVVDLSYLRQTNPRVAVEVLIGHGKCHIINETSVHLSTEDVDAIVRRIAGNVKVDYVEVPQDKHLADNQKILTRCGDNGIFKGTPITAEQKNLTRIARNIFDKYPTDGKYLLDKGRLIICQSGARKADLQFMYPDAEINPIGDWSGGLDVDTGATNRKLGSDMGDGITGGGLHGKDLSKADVSLNIVCFLRAQKTHKPCCLSCAIGDYIINGKPYSMLVEEAREYIKSIGGFEKLAEWGLIR